MQTDGLYRPAFRRCGRSVPADRVAHGSVSTSSRGSALCVRDACLFDSRMCDRVANIYEASATEKAANQQGFMRDVRL
jgi:hypothetical protein